MYNKELSDYHKPGEGWIECWICPKCGRPWPPETDECPRCNKENER